MPSATAKGYPYPLGTDRVQDGDNDMRALAEAVDTKQPAAVSMGGVTLPFPNAVQASVAVTFPVGRFTVPPITMAICNSHAIITVTALAVTASGFTAFGRQIDGVVTSVSAGISWHASQMLAGAAAG